MRNRIIREKTYCKVCGSILRPWPKGNAGYCKKCFRQINKEWFKIAFSDRVRILSLMGVKLIGTYKD